MVYEDIVGRVAQYVDEHYPVDKWQIIGVKISSTCELSKCLWTTKDDRVKKLSHLVKMSLAINAGSDRWLVRLQKWSSSRLNRDSSLKMTSVTLQVARGRQNPVDTAYDVGSVVAS
ncbi:hypothetical protein TNCV_3761121 [Trichonephila clavipes]|nr:hypothetical protein TNCV_3761121 [Trichonephila clavipes]